MHTPTRSLMGTLMSALLVTMIALPGLAWADDAQDAPDTPQSDDPEVTMADMAPGQETAQADTDRGAPTVDQRGQRLDYPSHWSWVIAGNALAGGIGGGLVGAAILLVRGDSWDGTVIGQFIGGGILVGTTVGIVELLVRTSGPSSRDADRPASVQWIERDLPATYAIYLIEGHF